MKILEMPTYISSLASPGIRSTVTARAALVSPSVHEHPVHGVQRQQSCLDQTDPQGKLILKTYIMVNDRWFCKCHETLLHGIWKRLATVLSEGAT